jgi:dTMP kinase
VPNSDNAAHCSGKLIVLEGLDGSGKSTQLERLHKHCESAGCNVRHIKLPDYGSPACAPVEMYLDGNLGGSPADVNAYAASSFYAIDRFISYRTKWRDDYEAGTLLLADRYTTSNAYHQMVKLPDWEWDGFLDWLEDYEYTKLGLPRPSLVIYLDMPVEVSRGLMKKRGQMDIHERDTAYLSACRIAAHYVAERLGWQVVPCAEHGEPLSAELIERAVRDCVAPLLESAQ